MGRRKDIHDYMTMIEKGIFTLVVLSFTLMAVAQVLMQDESWRNYLNFSSRLESQKIVINEWQQEDMPVSTDLKNVGYLNIKLERFLALPKAYILVNGREVKRFNSDNVMVQVRPGDIVEIDGTYYKQPFEITITEVTGNISLPHKNQNIQVDQDIVTLAEVKFVQ